MRAPRGSEFPCTPLLVAGCLGFVRQLRIGTRSWGWASHSSLPSSKVPLPSGVCHTDSENLTIFLGALSCFAVLWIFRSKIESVWQFCPGMGGLASALSCNWGLERGVGGGALIPRSQVLGARFPGAAEVFVTGLWKNERFSENLRFSSVRCRASLSCGFCVTKSNPCGNFVRVWAGWLRLHPATGARNENPPIPKVIQAVLDKLAGSKGSDGRASPQSNRF